MVPSVLVRIWSESQSNSTSETVESVVRCVCVKVCRIHLSFCPSRYGSREAVAYAASRLQGTYGATLRVLNEVCSLISYGAYISWVFNFVNFANFESFTKFISVKILTATVRYTSSACVCEMKFQKTAIREKLDLRNIIAIR